MRNGKRQGFTLIELLIVIAIIGILAAVLIPNLLSARRSAQDRATQAFGSQVYTAINAGIATDPAFQIGSIPTTCTAAAGYTITVTSGGQQRVFTAPAPGAALKSCTITLSAATNEFAVNVVSANDAAYTLIGR